MHPLHVMSERLILYQIYALPSLLEPVYTAPALSALPPVLTTDNRQRRAAAREALTEIMFADLGDKCHQSPYLIVRQSFHSPWQTLILTRFDLRLTTCRSTSRSTTLLRQTIPA